MEFIQKLKQRKIVQWAFAYLAGAWLLLQVLDVLSNLYDLPRLLLRGTPILLVVGFLAVLVVAWYHGEKGQQRISGIELVLLASLLVLAGFGLAAIDRPDSGPQAEAAAPEYSRAAIAVLPFDNLSGETHAYFAGGLHDEILTQLSRVAALKVISRTSVMGYATQRPTVRQIARDLGVGSVVEGSVQVVDNRLRVNVQLIDVATDAHLWAESYDRTLDDAFAIQSEVAQQIVTTVGATLKDAERLAIARAPTANPEAYRLYLQGRQYFARPGFVRQNYEMAEQLYERAIALDPDFALAYAALADVHATMFSFRIDATPARVAQLTQAAEAALRLAPQLAEAHLALSYVYGVRGDYERAIKELQVAVQGLPNSAELWRLRSELEGARDNWEGTVAAQAKAVELDPRDATQQYGLALLHTWRRHYPEAIRGFDRALVLSPDFYVAAIVRGWTYVFWQGRLDTMRATLRRVPADAPLDVYGTRMAHELQLLYWSRQPDSMLQRLAESRATVLEGQPFFWPTRLYAALAHQLRGDTAAARPAFEAARVVADSVLRIVPDDWRVHIAKGLALAGLGQRAAAIHEADLIMQNVRYQKNSFWHGMLAEGRARIFAQAGETDASVAELQQLLGRPAWFSAHAIRLDPLYDPIRSDPRIRELIAQHAQ